MVRFIRLTLLLVLLVVLQTTVFPHLRVAGVVPDLGLVAAVAIAVRYGPELGAAFGFAAGLAADLFLQTPLGLAALAFALTAYLVGRMQSLLVRPTWWVSPAIAIGAGIVAGLLFVGIGSMVGQDQLFALRSLRTIVLAAIYDGVIALVLFPFAISVAEPRTEAARHAAGYSGT
jgi:rod shape-determining protein MreD